ncbi:Uncharacterized conserved protein [Variovorax sp. CF079]|uniref:YciI family protein n=1 Tax=Variovorax sp. CF079 TaxID=1882774 RepID=UPI000891B4D2|nr:YciI family protein [Variovorax sp. CF079]SDE11257.1 Uncharacterized conserved protein [Variovorax sp. CF079]
MRYVILRKAGPHGEAGLFPPLSPVPGIVLHESAELQPSAAGVRISFSDKGPQQTPGPFTESKQVVAGLSIVEADSQQTAIDWLRDAPVGDAEAEFEIRETGCAGGLSGIDPSGAATKPRFLILVKADAATEAEAPSDPARLAAMARRNDEGVKAGVLLSGDGLRSTARSTRVKLAGGRNSVMDGPFAEAKELVAGYWLIQADSLDEAIAWVRRYPYAQERPEVEIRPVVWP